MVENHYDFVNKETHASNARLERLFKQYAAQPGESVAVAGVAVYLPSEQLNALFLLRHAAVHFAAINIGLRHVLDWCVFVAHCHDRIDWPALYAVARETRMVGFLNCLNALCVDCLGLEAPSLPDFERDAELEKAGAGRNPLPGVLRRAARRVAARGPVQDPPLVGEPLETPAGLRRGSCRRLRAFSLGASETSAVDRRVTVLSGTNPGFGCTGEFCRRPPGTLCSKAVSVSQPCILSFSERRFYNAGIVSSGSRKSALQIFKTSVWYNEEVVLQPVCRLPVMSLRRVSNRRI